MANNGAEIPGQRSLRHRFAVAHRITMDFCPLSREPDHAELGMTFRYCPDPTTTAAKIENTPPWKRPAK